MTTSISLDIRSKSNSHNRALRKPPQRSQTQVQPYVVIAGIAVLVLVSLAGLHIYQTFTFAKRRSNG